MKDIKVKFSGRIAPSGKRTGVPYMIGKSRLELLNKSGKFDIEIIEEPKAAKKTKRKKINSF